MSEQDRDNSRANMKYVYDKNSQNQEQFNIVKRKNNTVTGTVKIWASTDHDRLQADVDNILAFGYQDPTFINDIHMLIDPTRDNNRVGKAKEQILALIAREVRLGKIEELKTILFGAYGTDDISGRIKELEDE